MDRIIEALNNNNKNYILPLFWQHGESDDIIRREINKIRNAGITEFCVESRPFEDFCGEKWWENMDNIISEAKRLNMRVWIFDDKHFPSGYANGVFEFRRADLRKRHLIEKNTDVSGPVKDAAILLPELRAEYDEKLVGAAAMRRSGTGENLTGEAMDLSGNIHDGMLWLDVPEGVWRVFFFIDTQDGTSGRSRYMLDPLEPRSCRMMIDEVYEPHYKRYKDEFGKTIAGFFSDEPGFRNLPKGYCTGVGTAAAFLPWNNSLTDIISDAVGTDVHNLLAALWYDCGEITAKIRCAYMDAVSRMYSENFCKMLGDWCRERGVMYIGHVLEDMNVSSRLGPGAGHYFRALGGQDMSGIDAVYHQLMPGFGDMPHAVFASTRINDPEFYDFALGKLGASMAHIQPNKNGRALCECFGGYGWAEGLPLMKWQIDHFLAAGINYFVPHAFSPKENDPDCPPHLYGGGGNPQYEYLKILSGYMNRMCHILNGGKTVPSAAVIYHAEAEWCGGKYMYEQKPLKMLLKRQLDCDIIPYEAIADGSVQNGRLVINGTEYPCVIAPYAEILPNSCLALLERLKSEGCDVIFTDAPPRGYKNPENIESVSLNKVAEYASKYADVRLSEPFPDLRILHLRRGGTDIYMLNNESVNLAFDGTVHFSVKGGCAVYDALHNTLEKANADGGLKLLIPPCRPSVVVFGEIPDGLRKFDPAHPEMTELKLKFDIDIKECGQEFVPYKKDAELTNITAPGGLPRFCGKVRYRTEFDSPGGSAVIDLGEVGEIAELFVNGESAGCEICPPYRFDVNTKKGVNSLEVIVANNPAYKKRDKYSRFIALKPSGLIGAVKIGYK